ncbi:hypothetical protein [Microvirga aerophila]|uniref:hypothetical protein n=1 Tax=Microvirga aerophila TaxID=670291 RepID=UPI0011BF1458|nr:hypothetical protein [Microvirga aerophila]
MKKSQKPFTFEVKRSRLLSPKASTFQRYVAATERHQTRKAPDASGLQVVVARTAAPLPSKARILPSLMRERVWIEELMLPVPVASSLSDVPEVVEEPEAVVEALPAAPEVMASRADLPRNEPGKPKQGRPRAKSPDDLPRGERWKRRLPRTAW